MVCRSLKLTNCLCNSSQEDRRVEADHIAFRTQEIASLATEAEQAALEQLNFQARLRSEDADEAEKRAWAKHLACNPLPDAESVSDVNTYISIATEELPTTVVAALTEAEVTESVAADASRVLASCMAAGDLDGVASYRELCDRLRKTTTAKLENAALELVSRPDEHKEKEDDHVMVIQERGGIKCGIWANLITRSFRGPAKPIVFKGLGLQVDIPRQINLMKVALRVVHFPYDALSPTAAAPPAEVVVGGVVHLEFDMLPSAPKVVKPQWLMRPTNVLATKLQRFPYGEEHGAAAITAPLKVHMRVPQTVYIIPGEAERTVVFWEGDHWTGEGVQQDTVVFNETSRALQFMTTRSGFFALAQSRVVDLPYWKWSLAPAIEVTAADSAIEVDQDEEGCVHFTLETSRVSAVTIQVRGNVCQLVAPPIAGLFLKPLAVGELLLALQEAGINLMPLDSDAEKVSAWEDGSRIALKSTELERKIHRELASVAAAFDCCGSRWNKKVHVL